MTNDEAKMLLHACRVGDRPPDDPRLVEALELTRRDPELLAWFIAQQSMDATIADRLQNVPVPNGLAEGIVAGRKERLRKSRHRYRWPVALAATLILLLTLGALLSGRFVSPPTEYAALQTDMAEFLVTFPRLDLATDQWPAIARWLTSKPGLSAAQVPSGLEKYPGLGCREIQWRGKSLMLVCFAAQGQIVHLFVLPSGEFQGAPEVSTPNFNRVGGWNMAGWTRGSISYLALTKGDRGFLRKLIGRSM